MYIAIIAIVLLLRTPAYVFASVSKELTEEERESGFYDEEGRPFKTENRSAINPGFDPVEDCNIAYELKCNPGSLQKCSDLEGFNNGENNVCSPIERQDGYANPDDEETGLCITYEKCESDVYADNGYILLKDANRCAYSYRVYDEPEHREKDYCD
jgi:hypothetical protein